MNITEVKNLQLNTEVRCKLDGSTAISRYFTGKIVHCHGETYGDGYGFTVMRYDVEYEWGINVNILNCHLIDYLLKEWDNVTN